MDISQWLYLSDTHHPFQDQKKIDLLLDAAEDNGIENFVLGGDIADFININSHGEKHPDIRETLEEEVASVLDFLEKLRKRFKKARIVYLFGNHENRLQRFILNNCKAFWNIVKLEEQLQLDFLDIEYYRYNHCFQIEKTNLFCQHSPPSYAVNAAMTSLKKKLDINAIYSCTHREDFASMTGASGQTYRIWMNGFLGDNVKHKEVFSYMKGHENWQHGAKLITVIGGKQFKVQRIDFDNNSIIVNGNLYES